MFCKLIQVTKRLSTPKFLKRSLLYFNPFNKFAPPLYLVGNLVLGCERDKRVSSFLDHDCNGVKCLWAIFFKGLDHLFLFCFEKFYRETMIIQFACFAQRSSTCNMAHLLEGNKVEYPRGASVRSVVYFHAHLSCIRS